MFWTAMILDIIFIDFINISSDFNEVLNNLKTLFSRWLGEFSFKEFLQIFIPQVSLSINDIFVALEFPRTFLQPINAQTGEIEEDETIKSKLRFNIGELKFSTEDGIEFFGEDSFTFTKSEILNTGLILEFSNARVDLSRSKNIPQATIDGRPNDFVGVFISEAAIELPKRWFNNTSGPSIIGKNLIIGTGGISGTIGFDAAGTLQTHIGSMEVELKAFDITFQQNSIIESNIHGKLTINGFEDAGGGPAEINIDISITNDGDFKITASEDIGITALRIPDIMDFIITSLSIGRHDDKFFIAVSGAIDFTLSGGKLKNYIPDQIDIRELIIPKQKQILKPTCKKNICFNMHHMLCMAA